MKTLGFSLLKDEQETTLVEYAVMLALILEGILSPPSPQSGRAPAACGATKSNLENAGF